MEIKQINADQAALVMTKSEGHFCDFKAIEIAPSKLTKSLSAFANAEGGELFVGFAEQKQFAEIVWRGFKNVEAANAHLQVVENLFPFGQNVRGEFLQCSELPGLVLHIEIDKAADIVNASDGVPYLRRGAQNLPQDTPEKIDRLKLNKGIRSFEDQTLVADVNGIVTSRAISDFINDVVPQTDPEAWLRKQKLIIGDKPTVAGVLLFDDEPQVEIPKAAIKLYRYKTANSAGSRETLAFDPVAIEGNAYNQIYDCVSRIKDLTESIPVMGTEGLEKIQYPTEAIHEIVTNAVIHRDYSLNDDIHVRIFENRIEVQSPGTLPAHITVRNILDERAARNPKVVRLLNKFKNPPNKDVGEGLNTAFEAMRSLKLKDPEVVQTEIRVLVILRHEKLGTPEEIIVEYLKDNDEINNAIARKICFIGSENTVKRIFQKMIQASLITRVPNRPLNRTAYIKGPKFPS